MNKKTVRDIDSKNKKVLVRCDFNVPYNENRVITDNRRIVAALPTIKYLLDNNCKVILCSHLGRPKGQVKPEFSLDIVAKELSRLLDLSLIHILIGERTAEDLKVNVGCVYPKIQDVEMDIRGRDLITGLPKTLTVHSSEMMEALEEPANKMCIRDRCMAESLRFLDK